MISVDEIAAAAFSGVAAEISDAVHSAVLDDGVATYSGRVVQDYKKPSGGLALDYTKYGMETVFLEGFSTAPLAGWTLTYAGTDYIVVWCHDTLASGGLYVAQVVDSAYFLSVDVSFEDKTRTADGAGGSSVAWAAIEGAPVLAYIGSLSGNEVVKASRETSETRKRLIVPYFDGLTADSSVVIQGVRHNITYVDNVEERSVWLEAGLEEGVSA